MKKKFFAVSRVRFFFGTRSDENKQYFFFGAILVFSTKKRYSSFLKNIFVFQKMFFKVKVLKTFKSSSDCHIKICQSVKRRPILKILNRLLGGGSMKYQKEGLATKLTLGIIYSEQDYLFRKLDLLFLCQVHERKLNQNVYSRDEFKSEPRQSINQA